MRKAIFASLISTVILFGALHNAWAKQSEQEHVAMTTGQLLAIIEICNIDDMDARHALLKQAATALSVSANGEESMMLLFSFGAGAVHQARNLIEKRGDVNCENGKELVYKLLKNKK